MRPRWLVLLVLVVLVSLATTAHAWSQSDFEIFDLVDELETSEGKDVNFYSWLNVKPTATIPDINRAYRKMSLKLQYVYPSIVARVASRSYVLIGLFDT